VAHARLLRGATCLLRRRTDKLKQENWDLNIAAQQFESDLAAQTALLKKAENERTRVNKDLLKTRDQLEAQRVQFEANAEELEKLRSIRETETAVARKEKAGMAREMSDLNALLSAARTEAQRASERDNLSRSLSRSLLSNDTSRNDDDDFSGDAAARRRGGSAVPGSPGAALDGDAGGHSPLGKRLDKDRDLTDLRAKLAMAHKRTGKDSMEKRRLREQNAELRLLLTKAGLSAPSASDVESSGDEAEQWADEPDSPAAGRLAKMRMPKSSTRPNIASRLGLGASRSSSMAFDEEEADEQDASLEEASDSAARRASLDGVDPAFAGDEYASAPKSRRRAGRKTLMQADLAGKGSPLSRTAYLAGEEADLSSERSFEDGSASGHTEQWGHAPSSRPASVSLEGGNLGAELAGLGGTSIDQPDTLAALLGETSQGALGLEREPTLAAVDHKDTQTEAQPDLLTPLIAERDAAHAELQQRDLQHRAVLAELEQREQQHSTALAEHAAALSALHLAHSVTLEERDSAHAQALSTRDTQHRRALEERAAELAAALDKRDEAHDAAMAARNESHAGELHNALAQQAQQHDAAIGEARSRHAQALAAEVAKGAAALTAAEVLHKKLSADQSTEHKRVIDRLGADHARAVERLGADHAAELAEKDTDHAGAIEDLQMSNDAYVRDLETAFKVTLREKDDAIKKSREEVEALRSRLSALEAELARLRADAKTAAAAAATASAATAQLNAALAAARSEAATETSTLKRELDEARAALVQAERDDTFEDATEVPSEEGKLTGVNGARSLLAPAMGRSSTHSTAGETDDMPQTPADEETDGGVRKVVLADLRDTSSQTDDDSWQRYQGAPRAMSSVSSAATLPAAGVVILGSHPSNAETLQPSRDSTSTFGGHRDGLPRPESPAPVMYTAGAVNRQHGLAPSGRVSMDSTHSSRYTDAEEAATLGRAGPPVMAVPPPPSMPPPPTLPPVESKRTVKSRPSAASSMLDGAPARPLSPPPPELVAMAAHRRISTLQVPPSSSDGHGRPASRLSTAAMPPPSSYVSPGAPSRQRPSLSSLRARTMSQENGLPMSAGRASDAASIHSARQSTASRRSHAAALGGALHLRGASAASFASDATSELSRRMSFASSHASDAAADGAQGGAAGLTPPSTDPMVIHAITQTMIGEYLHKYTRRTMGRSGHSEKRHRRYFWLHPYTNMLYWTLSDPGSQNVREGMSKGAVIEGVRVVEDTNPSPAGLYHLSIVVKTPQRDVKITAPDRERHEMWLTAFDFLISKRNSASAGAATAAVGAQSGSADFDPDRTISPRKAGHDRTRTDGTIGSKRFLSPARSMASLAPGRKRDSAPATESTPRRRGASIGASSTLTGKRRDTAAHEYLKQWDSVRGRPMSPTASIGGVSTSRRSVAGSERRVDRATFEPTTPLDPRLQTAEQMLEEDEGENFDGLENVRACCNGAHDVGDLAHKKYQSQMSARTRRGSVRSRHSRASSVLQPGGGSGRDSASLRAISPPPHLATPQLGALSLNAPHQRFSSGPDGKAAAAADAEPGSARTSNSLDWFSSNEQPASGRTTPAGLGSTSPTASTFTDRISKIRAGRPSAGPSGSVAR
jgi:hypothetical protein